MYSSASAFNATAITIFGWLCICAYTFNVHIPRDSGYASVGLVIVGHVRWSIGRAYLDRGISNRPMDTPCLILARTLEHGGDTATPFLGELDLGFDWQVPCPGQQSYLPRYYHACPDVLYLWPSDHTSPIRGHATPRIIPSYQTYVPCK
ncbi:hypothetical protein BJ138DRAFT_62073 [Hygrophoropsis aurantiaca]|uniref:Uncharacterized protein n=1 Tax=Hygrophoropsis aurantiaca TaxID=72124 RepID=A0ACB8ABU0_9AGAM|nr:hypothetical protein BJ138DRAFT_62073 [Hygrophoropsis aurantiaca]